MTNSIRHLLVQYITKDDFYQGKRNKFVSSKNILFHNLSLCISKKLPFYFY